MSKAAKSQIVRMSVVGFTPVMIMFGYVWWSSPGMQVFRAIYLGW